MKPVPNASRDLKAAASYLKQRSVGDVWSSLSNTTETQVLERLAGANLNAAHRHVWKQPASEPEKRG